MSLKIVKTKNRNLHLLKETSELEPPVVFLIHEIVENKSHDTADIEDQIYSK